MTDVWMAQLWMIALFAVAAYCFVRGIVDLRQRRIGWGVAGLLSGVILMATPISTHAVKFDLPRSANS